MDENDSTRTNEQEAEEAIVTVYPQIWHNARAVTSDEKERFKIPIEDATDDDGELLPDDSGESDPLKNHENAPERARKWQGPFYVTVDRIGPVEQ